MAAIAATNSATLSLQVQLTRSRIDAARREADQAESYAKTLRAQAQEQEQVVIQARDRVQSLENSASKTASNPVIRTSNVTENSHAASAMPVVTVQQKSTYAGVLSDVFQAAKPILESVTSSTEKNLVMSSLLKATNNTWTSSQAISKVQVAYNTQGANPLEKGVGQVLNTVA